MLKIGCHLSVAHGYLKAAKIASEIGANAFQYFSRNPQGYRARPVDRVDIRRTVKYLQSHNMQILAHAPYTLNLCAFNADTRYKGREMLEEDLDTLDLFDGGMYVFHPGAYTDLSRECGLNFVSEGIKSVVNDTYKSTVLLELMSGRGTELGRTFEEIQTIIEKVEDAAIQDKIGVCLDTCHVFAAGYDIKEHLNDVIEQFDAIIGLNRLKAIHLNDSAHPLGSHKDRHAKIGEGMIGTDALVSLINHEKLKDLPFFLETPCKTPEEYGQEIAFLKENYNG